MPRRRDLKNLPPHVYRELYHFCMQYPEWKEKIKAAQDARPQRITDTPRGGCVSSPTERAAEKVMALTEKIKLIQDTVKESAPPEAQKGLLLNVTRDVSFVTLYARHEFYIPQHTFLDYRRKFFYNLAKKKGRI